MWPVSVAFVCGLYVADRCAAGCRLAALRLGSGAAATESGHVLSVITPVRRSTRRKSLKPPANPHLALFDSVEAISESLRRSALFRTNSALLSP